MNYTKLVGNFPGLIFNYFYVEEITDSVFHITLAETKQQKGIFEFSIWRFYDHKEAFTVVVETLVISKEEALQQISRYFLVNHNIHISVVYPFINKWYYMMLDDGIDSKVAASTIKTHIIEKLYNKVNKEVLLTAYKLFTTNVGALRTDIYEFVKDKTLYPVICWFSDNEDIDNLQIIDLVRSGAEEKEIDFSFEELFESIRSN